jgi:3-hydroxymyristoyl/3-hydroxydecanoyl-(acyl carrier protein) dehydratase
MPSAFRMITAGHPAFAGHFPGRPLLPGVALLAEVLEAMLADPTTTQPWQGPHRLATAKFLAPVEPGAQLRIDWTAQDGRVRFEVWRSAAGATADPARPFDAAAVLSASGTWETALEGDAAPVANPGVGLRR